MSRADELRKYVAQVRANSGHHVLLSCEEVEALLLTEARAARAIDLYEDFAFRRARKPDPHELWSVLKGNDEQSKQTPRT